MIELKSADECEVCGRCIIACPMGAIHYELGEGKHNNFYPVIDKGKCVQCYACKKACDKLISFESDYLSARHYIGYYIDEKVRNQSTSGGVFSALAMEVLRQDGIVIGAAYDEDTYSVKHIAVTRVEDLQKLRKSKYVQSDWISAYGVIKEAVSRDRWILFSGTPCQATTVKEQFGDYDKIYIVDLFCRGVPMAGMLREYMNLLEDHVTNIDFRHKQPNKDSNLTIHIQYKNGNAHVEKWVANPLCRLFVNSASLKKACFHCKYVAQKHISDITLGDFFAHYDYALAKGIDYPMSSVIAVNSLRGMQLFEKVREQLVYCDLEDENLISLSYRRHESMHGEHGNWGYHEDIWDKFQRLCQENGFAAAVIELFYEKELELIKRIEQIKGEEDNIILYGAGIVGRRVQWTINAIRSSWKIKSFVETQKGDTEQIANIPIISLDELPDQANDNDIVVVAVSSKYVEDIVKELEKRGLRFIY